MRSSHRVFPHKTLSLSICVVLAFAVSAQAGPEGGEVVGGEGSISQAGTVTTINQLTDRMAIDWQSFNVAEDERVDFIQPGRDSVALNRILSFDGSRILGSINANGTVVLMNPQGVFFGENATVNAGGILATGLTIDANDFMNGDFTFRALEGADGLVLNQGLLNASLGGSVALVGKQVENEGVITAELGSVTFAAGREAVVTFGEGNFIGVRVKEALVEEGIGVDPAVINSGEINAKGGKVLLTASTSRDVFSNAVNNEDMDYGRSVVFNDDGTYTLGGGSDVENTGSINVSGEQGGNVVLLGEDVINSGSITANSESGTTAGHIELHSTERTILHEQSSITANAGAGKGGDVKILGEQVALIGDSLIEANGATGGGEVLVGGDYRGQNTHVRNASQLVFGETAEISANAAGSGDGGRVILWANDQLTARGFVAATGKGGGDGGFVETSSGVVQLDLSVDVSAQFGNSGQWLIDPYDITIGGAGPNNLHETDDSEGFDSIFRPNTVDDGVDVLNSHISIATLRAALIGGSNVKIETSGDSNQLGNITLASNLSYVGTRAGQINAALTLEAHNDIYINADVLNSDNLDASGLNFSLVANSDSFTPEGMDSGGDIIINPGVTINTRGGFFHASANNFTLGQQQNDAGNILSSTINTTGLTSVNSGLGGNVTIHADGAVNIYDNITTNGGTFTVRGREENPRAGSFTSVWEADGVAALVEDRPRISTYSTTLNQGHIDVQTTGDIRFGNIAAGSNLTLDGNPDTDETLFITFDSNANIFHLGDVAVDSGNNAANYTTEFSLNAGGNITVGTRGFLDNGESPDNDNNPADVRLIAGGDVTIAGDNIALIDNDDDTNIYTRGGSIVIQGNNLTIGQSGGVGQINAEGGDIEITMRGDIDLYDNVSEWGGVDWYREGENAIKSRAGNITISGNSFTSNGDYSISTRNEDNDDAAAHTVSITTAGGDAILGTIDLYADPNDQDGVFTTGNLVVNASGNITNGTGHLIISGNTTLDAYATTEEAPAINIANIGLNSVLNDFQGEVFVRRANDAVLTDANSIALGTAALDAEGAAQIMRVGGALTVAANGEGNIVDNGNLEVVGAASFTATGNSVTLDAANDFRGEVGITATTATINDIAVNDGGVALALGSVNITGDLTLNAAGAITDSAIEANSISVGGTLTINAYDNSGDTTQYFNATLDRRQHSFSDVTIANADDVSLRDIAGGVSITIQQQSADGVVHVDASGLDPNQNGGDISILGNGERISLGNINASAAAGAGSGAGGTITVAAFNSLQVNGVMTSTNSDGSAGADFTALGTSGGDDTFTVGSDARWTGGAFILNGNGGEDTFHISSGLAGMQVNGGGNVDTFYLYAGAQGLTGSLNGLNGDDDFYIGASTDASINGNGGDDDFYITAANISVRNINGGNGGTNIDNVYGLDHATERNFWAVTGANAVSVRHQEVNEEGTPNLIFSNIENLYGGQRVEGPPAPDGSPTFVGGQDTFFISSNFSGRIDGRSGADRFVLMDRNLNVANIYGGEDSENPAQDGISSIDTIKGYDDPATGNNAGNVWTITGIERGTVQNGQTVTFQQIEAIEGGDLAGPDLTGGIDNFILDEAFGAERTIDAGQGQDNLSVSIAGTHEVSLGGQLGGISNIESIRNSTGSATGFILALSADRSASPASTYWTIDDANSGTLRDAATVEGSNNTLIFEGFSILYGNQGNDTFTVTSSGSIGEVNGISHASTLGVDEVPALGNNENNVLTLQGGTHQFLLNAPYGGNVTGSHELDFTQLQTLNGTGSDTLTARDQNNTWTLGASQTVGLTTNNPVPDQITFTGMSTLNGGNAEDRFAINATGGWQLNGNGGADRFTFDAAGMVTGAGSGIDGGTSVDAQNQPHQDRVVARNAENIWSINATDSSGTNTLSDSSNTLYLSDFKNIEHLEGSAANPDTFDFALSIAGLSITAGAGDGDIASYADVVGGVSITIDSSWGVETYVGNNDGLTTPSTNTTTLTFASNAGQSVAWFIGDTDPGGDVSDGINDGTINTEITFRNVNNLTGGEGNDTFTFDPAAADIAGLTGVISGGNSGSTGDAIVGRNVVTDWQVAPASSEVYANMTYANGRLDESGEPGEPPVALTTTTQFTGIETLTSGNQNDVFTVGRLVAEEESLTLYAGEGTDVLNLPDVNIDLTLGQALSGLSVNEFETLTANASRNNSLTVSSATGVNVTWTIDEPNSGLVQVGSGSSVDFNHFQVLQGGGGNDTFDFTTESASVVRTNGEGSVDGGGGTNTLVGRRVHNVFDINGNQGGFVQAVNGATYIQNFNGIQVLGGHAPFSDQFILRSAGSFTGTVDGQRVIAGNNATGSDRLEVESVTGQINEWRLLGGEAFPDRVQRINNAATVTSSIVFSSMGRLTGGVGTDRFNFLASGTYSGEIFAGEGDADLDIIDLSRLDSNTIVLANAVNGVQQAEIVIGSGANSTLSGINSGTNIWRVANTTSNSQQILGADGINDGVLTNGSLSLQFINFATLNGGDDAVDQFTLADGASISGSMNGGTTSGATTITDTLTVSRNNSVWTLTDANAGNVGFNDIPGINNVFTGIESITASGTGDRLLGDNQNNRWTISGVNSGNVGSNIDAGATSGAISFSGMENLVGNSGSDEFILVDNLSTADGQITGSILGTNTGLTDAVGAVDTIEVQSAANEIIDWNLGHDTEQGTTVAVTNGATNRVASASSIESLVGGAGRDNFDIESERVTISVDGAGGTNNQLRLGGADQTGYAAQANWQINGGANETVAAMSTDVSGNPVELGRVTFNNIAVAQGSGSRDVFTVSASSVAELYGRDGNDEFRIAVNVDTPAANVNTAIDGGGGLNEIVGANRDNHWILGGSDTDSASNTLNFVAASDPGVRFSGVQTFTGGSANDTFELRQGINANLAGGDGGDNTVYANHTEDTVVWTINGDASGGVSWAGSTTNFSAMQNLTGGVGVDRFTFADNDGDAATPPTARIAGLIDGGDLPISEPAPDPLPIDSVIDTLDVSIYTNGVVVELGSTAQPGSAVDGTSTLPNVNANNFEEIRAAEKDPETGENNQWLAITEGGVVVDWNVELADPESQFNEGIVQYINNLKDAVAIRNTQTRFYNFGSLQGYQGSGGQERTNIDHRGGNITGTYVPSTGQRYLDYDQVRGQIVVDVSPLITGLEGNADTLDPDTGLPIGNTLLRIAPSSDFNNANQWLVDGINSGEFAANYYINEDESVGLSFSFSGVNQLQGGSGDDIFTFAHAEDAAGMLGLRDGFIDGGGGADQIVVDRLDEAAQASLVLGVNERIGPIDSSSITRRFPEQVLDVDVFLVASRQDVIDIAAVETITVNDGNVHLMSPDTGTATWSLGSETGSELHTILNETSQQTLQFTGVQRVIGGGADDTFNVLRLGAVGDTFTLQNVFDGGAGTDQVDLTEVTDAPGASPLTLSVDGYGDEGNTADIFVSNLETLTLSGDNHRLLARSNTVNTWTIDRVHGGTLAFDAGESAQSMRFSGVMHLVGGDLQDVFTFSGAAQLGGTIDGGGQVLSAPDQIVLSDDLDAPHTFVLSERDEQGQVIAASAENSAVNTIAFAGIEELTAAASQAANTTLIAGNYANTWAIGGIDSGLLTYSDADAVERRLQFTSVANLTGGSRNDDFYFTRDSGSGIDDQITGVLRGGEQLTADTVFINGLQDLQVIALGTENVGDLNIVGIEHLDASLSANNTYRLQADNTTNRWEIDGRNHGTVAGLEFTNIAYLVGGSANDTFVLDRSAGQSADDFISGLIDGGITRAGEVSVDEVNLTGLTSAIMVSQDTAYVNDVNNAAPVLRIAGIDRVDAMIQTGQSNTFVGRNALIGTATNVSWTIDGENSGRASGTHFSGFNALLGRDQADTFAFSGDGVIRGTVNGGSQPAERRDIVDVSEASIADVTIGASTQGFIDIEEYRGNNTTSRLTADDIANTWSITTMNGGSITDEQERDIAFSGFAYLIGGDAVDRFEINGGGVAGEIQAGGDDDHLSVLLGAGINGDVDFDGGEGSNTVLIQGGSSEQRFSETYLAQAGGAAQHTYGIVVDDTEYDYALRYQNTETVNDNVFTNTLVIQSLANTADTIALGNNRFVIRESNPDVDADPATLPHWADVNILNKDSVAVQAEQSDLVLVDALFTLGGQFSVNNAAVAGEGDSARIVAGRAISFTNTGTIGDAQNRLTIDTQQLALNSTRQAVYLDHIGDLALSALVNPAAAIDINVDGNITDSSALLSSQPLTLTSTGDITLDNANNLSGPLSLLALTGDITLANGVTQFANVQSDNLRLQARGNVSDGELGNINIATQFSVDATPASLITLDNSDNQFNLINLQNAGSLTLNDSSDNGITVQGQAANRLTFSADNAITINDLSAADITATSRNQSLSVQNFIDASNSVTLSGQGLQVIGALTVSNNAGGNAISLDATSGDMLLAAPISAQGETIGDIRIAGNGVTQQLGALIEGGDIAIISAGDTSLMADITATNGLSVQAGANLVMQSNGVATHTQAQSIEFFSELDMFTEALTADTVQLLSANGSITQNGPIQARSVTIDAANGSYELTQDTTLNLDSGSASIAANQIRLQGSTLISNGDLTVTASDTLLLGGQGQADNISMRAAGSITMSASANLEAQEQLSLTTTGGELALASVTAGEAVTITAQGLVSDNNGSDTNISAPLLTVRSDSGFGGYSASNTIETEVATLDVLNASGDLGLTNNGELTVNALITDGNIRLVNNNGSVALNYAADTDYERNAPDPRNAGGVINANYASGEVIVVISNGALTASGVPSGRRPELVGDIVNVSTTGGFGVDRQLVVYAQTELIISGRGIRPIWAFGAVPAFGLTTDSDLIDPVAGGNVSELLIEVEAVEDINPAVFTNVRNYAYENISIRMPRDQIYDEGIYNYDDEEDDEDGESDDYY